MTEGSRREDADRRSSTGPVGTLFGATFGPFGAAVGSVVDANRLALTFSFGTVPTAEDGFDDATTVEITEPGEEETEVETGTESDAADDADGSQ